MSLQDVSKLHFPKIETGSLIMAQFNQCPWLYSTTQTEVKYVYLQCHAVYTAATLQHMQCTCSIGCSYTSDTLQTAVYTVPTLYIHNTVDTLRVHCIRQCTLPIHCRVVSYGSIFVHCTYTASKWQCTCSIHCSYTGTILPIHSTSVWACSMFRTTQIELQCTCSAPQCTLQTHSNTWSVSAVEAVMQPTWNPHCMYTAHALQFDLGNFNWDYLNYTLSVRPSKRWFPLLQYRAKLVHYS